MVISSACVTAVCDACEDEFEEIPLTSLAGGGRDERSVVRQLKKLGWRIDGGRHICPNCVEDMPDA